MGFGRTPVRTSRREQQNPGKSVVVSGWSIQIVTNWPMSMEGVASPQRSPLQHPFIKEHQETRHRLFHDSKDRQSLKSAPSVLHKLLAHPVSSILYQLSHNFVVKTPLSAHSNSPQSFFQQSLAPSASISISHLRCDLNPSSSPCSSGCISKPGGASTTTNTPSILT